MSQLFQQNLEALSRAGHSSLASDLEAQATPQQAEIRPSRSGEPTMLWGTQSVHSLYDPRREAENLARKLLAEHESGPLHLVGFGLGYLPQQLLELAPDLELVVHEPHLAVLRLALETRDLRELWTRVVLHAGQPLHGMQNGTRLHRTPGARIYLEQSADFGHAAVARKPREQGSSAIGDRRLRILVVGPLYGGSLPVAGYVDRAFRELGHPTELYDNSAFDAGRLHFESTIKTSEYRSQLLDQYVRLLADGVAARAIELRAQLVFYIAQSPVSPSAVRQLKQAGIPTAFWFVEDHKLFPYGQKIAPLFDAFFHIQGEAFSQQLRRTGATPHYLPMAADPAVHKPLSLSEEQRQRWGGPLTHVGAGYPNRRHLFPSLAELGLKVWGSDWDGAVGMEGLLQEQGRRVNSEESVAIFNASSINLNLHSSMQGRGVNPDGDFVNPRTFEVAAAGGFQLVDERTLLPELFVPGREIASFRDSSELREAIEHYLQHPDERASIAQAGRRRVLENHTYRHRMEKALELIFRHRQVPFADQRGNSVAELVEQAGTDEELAALFRRMGQPDEELSLEGIAETIRKEDRELGRPEAIFLLMDEFHSWAREKGLA